MSIFITVFLAFHTVLGTLCYAQSCLTFPNPMNCNLLGPWPTEFSGKNTEQVAIPYFRRYSQLQRDGTHHLCKALHTNRQLFTTVPPRSPWT